MEAAADDDLFDSLGVRGVSAETFSRTVLQAVTAGTPRAPENGALQHAVRLRKRLRTVGAELSVLSDSVLKEDGPIPVGFEDEHRKGRDLHRALAGKRLADLEAKQERLLHELRRSLAALPPGTDLDAEVAAQANAESPVGSGSRGVEKGVAGDEGSGKPLGRAGEPIKAAKRKEPVQMVMADDDDLFGDEDRKPGALVETERDRLIRKGILTPFDSVDGFERRIQQRLSSSKPTAGTQPRRCEPFVDPRLKQLAAKKDAVFGVSSAGKEWQASEVAEQMKTIKSAKHTTKALPDDEVPKQERPTTPYSRNYWQQPGSSRSNGTASKKKRRTTLRRSNKRLKISAPRRSRQRNLLRPEQQVDEEGEAGEGGRPGTPTSSADGGGAAPASQDSDYRPTDDSDEGSSCEEDLGLGERRRPELLEEYDDEEYTEEDAEGEFDDEDDDAYEARVQAYLREVAGMDGNQDIIFDGGYRMPASIWEKLFEYQQTGVKWMWELHTQKAGGIIGDEMGLGKTIQVAAFLAGLHHSGKMGASLIIAPATVLRQWLCELRSWYPLFRVFVLHDSMKNPVGVRATRDDIVEKAMLGSSSLVITTYEGLRKNRELLLTVLWSYVVLDEGHKIRNPDAEITLVCKQVATVHRIIMSGSPIQNRLQELWSLFDFVFPGKLGTLPVFQAQFAIPISIGGYTNASALQVSTAFRCAVTLRDLINPYLLRRRKEDVDANLPSRKEQVLFCDLTAEQRGVYRAYLDSKDVEEIFRGKRQALQGIDVLRKICNHPDLLDRQWKATAPDYGRIESSGKLTVTSKVLSHWRQQGHKALVFAQTQQMLDIIEGMVERQGYKYHRMDGNTNIAMRNRLVTDFNQNPGVFVFLLTTKVGGLGVNLTGANRVLLYDPDWNPSTDMQARERAWRIGQKRDVTVYRLITTGTIEEKVYHRQIYKQFLTNKVLLDPKQKRYFTAKNIRDLFTLGEENAHCTETEKIFNEVDGGIRVEDYAPAEIPPLVAGSAGTRVGGHRLTTATAGSDGEATTQDGAGASGSGRAERNAAGSSGLLMHFKPPAPEADDAKILKDLMDGPGLHTAMDHAKIEGASAHDREIIDQEAARVAQQAAQALRESRRELRRSGRAVSEPTWTGRSGSAGAPRFGAVLNPRLAPAAGRGIGLRGSAGAGEGDLSSTSLLTQMRNRQRPSAASRAGGGASSAPTQSAMPDVEEAQALAARIVSYIVAQGGRVAARALVDHFQGDVPASEMPLFRQLLKQVAAVRKRRDDSYWLLKPEFRDGQEA